MTPEEMRRHATRIVLDHARDIEFLSVVEMLEDELADWDTDVVDDLCRHIHDLCMDAKVTVEFPGVDRV